MNHRQSLTFWLAMASVASGGLAIARWSRPETGLLTPPEAFSFRDKYLASYGSVSLDRYILSYDILGACRPLMEADLLVLGSSKAMYGVSARRIQKSLEGKGLIKGAYNLGFGHGEGLVYPAWLIERMGIRDKIILMDATDNTGQYHLEPVSQEVISCGKLRAWGIVLENYLQFWLDRSLHGTVPRGVVSADGLRLEAGHMKPWVWRDWQTGDIRFEGVRSNYRTCLGKVTLEFDLDGRLTDELFPAFKERNLDYGFMSVPSSGYDPGWGKEAAEQIGTWYLPVDAPPLWTSDRIHLAEEGRELFTELLTQALASEEFGMRSRLEDIHRGQIHRPDPVFKANLLIPVHKATLNGFNVVLFCQSYYCIPLGTAVEWKRGAPDQVPGVVVTRSLKEAMRFVKDRRNSP